MQHVYKTANMLDILGFLIHVFERYSFISYLFELLLNFSRFISLTLQKLWEDCDSCTIMPDGRQVLLLMRLFRRPMRLPFYLNTVCNSNTLQTFIFWI